MYDSILTPQMLILHELSLKKCLFLSKNEYFAGASDSMNYASDSHFCEETCVRDQLPSGGASGG